MYENTFRIEDDAILIRISYLGKAHGTTVRISCGDEELFGIVSQEVTGVRAIEWFWEEVRPRSLEGRDLPIGMVCNTVEEIASFLNREYRFDQEIAKRHVH